MVSVVNVPSLYRAVGKDAVVKELSKKNVVTIWQVISHFKQFNHAVYVAPNCSISTLASLVLPRSNATLNHNNIHSFIPQQ